MRDPVVSGLLALLDEAYDAKAWHGTTLHGAISRIAPAQVDCRPGAGRHNAWELVVHAAYWKYRRTDPVAEDAGADAPSLTEGSRVR